MTVRSIAENLLRPIVIKRSLSAPFESAPIFVSPSASLAFLFKSMSRVDPALLALAREFVKTGSVVWDVGANVGLFAVAAAQLAGPNGRVICFEADTWLVQLLRRTAIAQRPASAKMEIVPAAVGAAVAIREFSISRRGRATNHLVGYGSSQTGGTRELQTVVSISLDWLAAYFPSPTILKIDVEGAELEVIRGAEQMLAVQRPVILCEVSSETASSVTDALHALRYRLYDGEQPQGRREVLDCAVWSTIAIPQ